jgi:hypothetical protein
MIRAHFRLTLSAPAGSLLRLLQITEYAWQRAQTTGSAPPLPAELAEALASFATGISPEQAYADLFGAAAPGWIIEPGDGTQATIDTVPKGASPVTMMCALAIAAPEAFNGDMQFVAKRPVLVN